MKRIICILLLTKILAVLVLSGQTIEKIGSNLPTIDFISSAHIGDGLMIGGDMGFFIRLDMEGNILQLEKTNAEDELNRYAMIESIDENGLAVGTGGSVFKLGGSSWDRLDFEYKSALRSVFSLDENRVVITGTQGKFYLSEDGGTSWAEKQAPVPFDINCAVKTDTEILLCGSNGLIISSGDFFETFTSSTQNVSGNILAACRPSITEDKYLLFTQEGKIYQLARADTSYTLVFENSDFTFTDWAQNGETIVASASADAILTSTDMGSTWTIASHPFDLIFYSVEYFNGKFILTGEDAHIVSFENGKFEVIAPKTNYDFHCAATFNAMLFAGTYDGKVVSTDNRGLSWTETETVPDEIIRGIESDGAGTLLFVTSGGSIFGYVGGGDSFAEIQSGIPEDGFQGLHYTGSSFFAVTIYGNIYKRTDNENWQKIYETDDSTAITDLFISEESGTGFAVGDKGKVVKTSDGGLTWYDMDALVDFPLFSVCHINDTWLIAGMYGILTYSTDGSEWKFDLSTFPDGVSYTKVSGKQDGSAILATSFSGKVMVSKDLGTSWEVLSEGYSLMTDIVWVDDNTAYAFGHNSNMYEIIFGKVAVEDIELTGAFLIYPSPATETLVVEIRDKAIQISEFKIIDMSGRVALTAPVSDDSIFEIDLTGFSSGVYFITLVSEEKDYARKFIVE